MLIKREQITWPGAVLRVAKEGVPQFDNNNVKGSLFATFDVLFPRGRVLTDEEKSMVGRLFGNKDATEISKKTTVTYAIPKAKPEGLGLGLLNPIIYNGFISSGIAGAHLSNSLR